MVNQTMQAFGMLNEERDDPTLKIPIQEGSTVPIQTTPVEKEPKLELPKEIEKQIFTEKSESILRPRARPEGLKINRQSPIDKVLELDYLLKGKPTRGSKTTQIISNLYEGEEDDQKAIKGFMDSAAGGDTGYDPTIEAWCAAFVAHILEQLGADPLKSKDRYDRLRANAYRNYGSAVDPKDIREGDIVVFDFDKNGTGDHVTFYAGDRITSQGEGNYINIVGGNHGRGEVSIRENHPLYIWDNVLATRRITYNDIDFEFTQEMAKQNPVFNKFLPKYAQLKTDAPATYSEGGLETGDANFKIMQEGFRESQAKRLEKNIEEAKETGKFLFESLPGISTAVTAQDITEELQKENPSYGKIALLGGAELIGLIPGLGTAAKAGLRAAAKKIGFDKVVDAIDAAPTDAPTPKPESEIIAGPGATGYEGLDLEKARKLKSMGYGSRQIEDMTSRFETGSVDDYIKNKKPQIIPNADLHELDNLRGVKEHLENLITDMKTNPSDYSLKSFALTDHIKIKQEELLKVNQKLTKLEKKYPTEFIEIESPFKFEIPDKGIIIKENNKYINYKEAIESSPMLVGDMIPTHKKLFKEYPHLEQVQFYIDPTLGNGAHFNPSKGLHGSIVVGDDFVGALDNINSPVFRNTFFHELQHAAQYQDFRLAGLNQLGGGPTTFAKAITGKAPYGIGFEAAAILKNPRAVKLKDEIINLFQKETKGLSFISTNSGNRYSNPKVAAKMAKLMRELEVENYKTYMKIASEVEAGAVGARAMPTFAKDQVRVSSEIAKRKKIETAEEYWKNKPDSRIKKIQKKLKSTVPMNQQEIEKYTGGGINFARYALGIDKELQGFTAFGVKESKRFNKGGLETGERIMNNQMEMAFMQQGGLKDDGMRQDPVSGNPIPNGSMAEEVRDDIPAQLSEGEYVVPADVVRYYGVKHFEDIRNNAKQGLQSMEANGRIGGEPVPVGGPKAAPQQMPQQQQMASDLSQDEMNELQSMMMNVGGFVDQPADPYQQQQTMYQQPMVMGAQAGTLATNNPTLFATTPSTISSGFSFEPPQQAAPAVDQAAKDAAETAKGTADCAAEGKDYDPVTKTCKPKTPQVTSGGDDGPAPTETPDPNAWMGEYDYTDPALLSKQITAALTTSKGQPSGIFGLLFNQFAPVGGLIDMVSKGTNAAKQAANIQLLEANGKPTGDLKILLEKYITDNRLTPLENLNLISGDGFYKTLIAEKGENPFGPGTTKTVVKQRTPRVITDKEKTERKKIASDLQAANKKRSSSKDKDPFASLTAAQQTSVGSASQGTASGQASAEAKAKAAGVDVKNLKGKDDEDYNLSGSGMVAGSNVGAGTGGVNYSGPMNKGGLATRRKTKGK